MLAGPMTALSGENEEEAVTVGGADSSSTVRVNSTRAAGVSVLGSGSESVSSGGGQVSIGIYLSETTENTDWEYGPGISGNPHRVQ